MSLEEVSIVPLKDVVKRVKVGFVGSCNNDYCSSDVGIPMIRTTNLSREGVKLENLKYISKEFHSKHIKSQINYGDILIARHGHNGLASLWKYNFDAQSLNVVIVETDDSLADKYYLTYLINSPLIQKQIKSLTGGSVQSVVNTKDIADLLIPVPTLKKQKEIANVLSFFDRKIQVNESINKNLEQLSQNLFKKWFIDFDLKNDFNISEPFKESTLGEIPESWEIKTIGDLSDVKGRIGWRGYTTNDLVDEGPWVIGGKEITSGFIDFNSAKHLKREKYEESPEIMLKDKDLIIAKTGTIGPIAMYYEIYGEATLNPNVGLIRSKNIVPALLLTFFKTQRAQYYLNEFTTSSVQPAINQTTIKQLEIALPSDKRLLEKLGAKFDEINLLQFNLNEEMKKLQKLRDTLLPKLMAGEIDVSKINCDMIKFILKNFTSSIKNNLLR